jgi:hypothetical protein
MLRPSEEKGIRTMGRSCIRRAPVLEGGNRRDAAPGGSAGRAQADQPPSGKTGAQFLGNGS